MLPHSPASALYINMQALSQNFPDGMTTTPMGHP